MGEGQEEIISIVEHIGNNVHFDMRNINSRGYVPPGDSDAVKLAMGTKVYSSKTMTKISNEACKKAYINLPRYVTSDTSVPFEERDTENIAENMLAKVRCTRVSLLHQEINEVRQMYESIHDDKASKCKNICSVMLDGASHIVLSDTAFASSVIVDARTVIDMAIGFTPVLSLFQDIISVTTGTNPVTNETIGNTERGLIIVGIIVPGVLKGTAKGINKAYRIVMAAIEHNGVAAKTAADFLKPVKKIKDLVHYITSHTEAMPSTKKRLAQAADSAGDIVDKTATKLRNSPGKARMSKELFNSKYILNGTHQNAGIVPKEIAESMTGKTYKTFDHFRQDFWKSVNESKYGQQFDAASRKAMKKGYAPTVHQSQTMGNRNKYELHHMTPINEGGSVYDLSNISIVTPRFHKEVLNREYHY